jgi:tetratricopeptide (TPR) repeat protein
MMQLWPPPEPAQGAPPMSKPARVPITRRLLARWWYLWGLSLCYAGNTTADQSFYRAGAWSFRRAITLWPELAVAHYQLGLIRGRELGEYRAAVADLERSSAIRPLWPEPYLQRGLLHRFNGEPGLAAAELRRFLELAPAGPWRDEAQRQLTAIEGDTLGGEAPVL